MKSKIVCYCIGIALFAAEISAFVMQNWNAFIACLVIDCVCIIGFLSIIKRVNKKQINQKFNSR